MRLSGTKIFKSVLFSSVLLWSMTVAQSLTHGPIVGGVTSSSANFVLRSDAEADLGVQLSTSSVFSSPISSSTFHTVSDSDFFGLVSASGLSPGTRYYYRAVINGTPVDDGIQRFFSTFPEEGTPSTFTFLTGSCQQAGDDPFSNIGSIFPVMAMENALFLLHQGDWGYPDTTDSPDDPLNYFSTDYTRVQETYEFRYDANFPMIDLLRKMPLDYTYDDHDMVNDNSDYTFPGIENSIRGYRSMFPHYPLPNPASGVWHKFTVGNVDIFVVDNRSQRDPNLAAFDLNIQDGDSIYSFNPGSDHLILSGNPNVSGLDQMSWLLQELQNSTADWKFISTGTPFNPGIRGGLELALLLQGVPGFDPIQTPGGLLSAAEVAMEFGDKWAGFPASIQTLLTHIIENNIQNVIFLSGDTHTSGLDDGANSIIPELMAGPLDRINIQLVALAEQFGIFIFNKGGHTGTAPEFGNAYGRVTVFGVDSVRLEAVAESGTILGKHTVQSGFIPARVGATVVPAGLDFGEVEVGQNGQLGFLVISTSIDTVEVSDITVTDPQHFFVLPKFFKVAPGEKQLVGVLYFPTAAGDTNQAVITVLTNDPDGPAVILAQGVGKQPTAIGEEVGPVLTFKLQQNYPNPFNPSTTIEYSIPVQSEVVVTVYDVLGRKVTTLLQEDQLPGSHSVVWDGTDRAGKHVSSGVYLYTIEAGPFTDTKKMVLIR